jgi:phage N-6-adenine-methyltransferase
VGYKGARIPVRGENIVSEAEKVDNSCGDEWSTPEQIWKPWHDLLRFRLDAAASKENAIVSPFLTKEIDALKVAWREYAPAGAAVWVNPPYSQAGGPLAKWIRKFWEESRNNGLVIVALLPSDTSTIWFGQIFDRERNIWIPGCRGTFLARRIKHVDPKTGKSLGSPKFGSIAVLFDRRLQNIY